MTRRFKAALAGLSSGSLLAVSAPANVSVPAGDCSGVLVMLGSMSLDRKALVLTSGHFLQRQREGATRSGTGELCDLEKIAPDAAAGGPGAVGSAAMVKWAVPLGGSRERGINLTTPSCPGRVEPGSSTASAC
jgi:hypothetical protein